MSITVVRSAENKLLHDTSGMTKRKSELLCVACPSAGAINDHLSVEFRKIL